MNLSNAQDVSMVGLDSLLFFNRGDIFTENILVLCNLLQLRLPSTKGTGRQLDHLR